jgi:hypothetical protein
MKTNLLKYYIVLAFFFSTVMLFAQGPGENDGTGTFEDTASDTTGAGAPIDDYVLILALVGSAFVFYTLKAYTKQGTTLEK